MQRAIFPSGFLIHQPFQGTVICSNKELLSIPVMFVMLYKGHKCKLLIPCYTESVFCFESFPTHIYIGHINF